MIKIMVIKLLKKHGLQKLLLLVGDTAVSITKTKKDDEIWAKIKKLIVQL